MGGKRGMATHLHCLGRCRWLAEPNAHRQLSRPRAPVRCGRKRGEKTQDIGRSRSGRTTKIHAITDRFCRPIRFTLTGGHVPDCIAAEPLLDLLPPEVNIVQGDKRYVYLSAIYLAATVTYWS